MLHTLPYYFAVSGYTEYNVPPSNLFKEFEDEDTWEQGSLSDMTGIFLDQLRSGDHFSANVEPIVPPWGNEVLRDMPGTGDTYCNVPSSNLFKESKESQKNTNGDYSVSLKSQSDCLLRISQSCLEQSLFRDHNSQIYVILEKA